MGKKSDPPAYPTAQMERQLDISEAMGNRYMDLSEQQQSWAEGQWTDQLALLQQTLGTQTDIMKQTSENAQEDRQRYEDVYQPIEDDLISDFMDFDSTERRDREAGRAQAGVTHAFDAQRRNAEQRLSSLGVDPSQVRGGALDLGVRIEEAKAQAGAGNQARNRVEDLGRSLRAEAINIGKGYPSQVAASYGQSLAAGNSAVGNMNATVGSGANTMGTGGSWGGMAGNQVNSTMSGINNMYSGQMSEYNAQGGLMESLGGLAGQAVGGWGASGFAKPWGSEGGGVVGPIDIGEARNDLAPQPGPNDSVPTMLEPGEYVIPVDAVNFYGTDKLDKMVAKARPEGSVQEGVEVGELPRPDGDGVVPGGPDGTGQAVIQGYEGGGAVRALAY